MNIDELKNTVKDIAHLRDELKKLSAKQQWYSLSDYIERFRNKMSSVDHGERDRFYMPYADASMSLSNLLDIDDQKLSSSFATNKTKLISCLNKYIKGMQKGFIAHEKEMKNG